MKKWMLVIAVVAFLGAAGIVLSQTSTPTAKETSDLQQQKEKTAAASPADLKAKEGEPSKTSGKPDPVAERKKKAQNLLNRCYQEALESEPAVKVRTLQAIASSMFPIDQKRAMFIYEQAFDSTQELQGSGNAIARVMSQSNIARNVFQWDLEKGLEMALRIEAIFGSGNQPSARLIALSLMVPRLAAKDPERAYGIVREEMTRGDCLVSLIVPSVVALQKKKPDLAEILYVEAIRQFDKPVSDAIAFQSFVDMTAGLVDLNRTLTGAAVEIILKDIDYLEEHPLKWDMQWEAFDGKTKVSFNGVREYAISKVIPMVRRLDPERAKGLEEKFSAYRELLAKTQEPAAVAANVNSTSPPAQEPGSSNTQKPSAPPLSEMVTYGVRRVIDRDAPASQQPLDTGGMEADRVARLEVAQIQLMALSDPKAAQARLDNMALGPYRIRAMAGMARSMYMTDPERAKSLLSDAALATEKLSDPYDQAECDGLIAEVFLPLDQDRAQQLLKEAFKLADQWAQEERDRKTNPKPVAAGWKPRQSTWSLLQPLLRTLGKLNIDDAIIRAEEIKDQETKLQALIQISNAILRQR